MSVSRARDVILVPTFWVALLSPASAGAQSPGRFTGLRTPAESLSAATSLVFNAASETDRAVYRDSVERYRARVDQRNAVMAPRSLRAAAHSGRESVRSSVSDTAAERLLVRWLGECCLRAARAGSAAAQEAAAVVEAVRGSQMAQTQQRLLANLDAFERKYGPKSPRLSVVEVALNYGAQWLTPFQPSSSGRPSALEVVANYAPDYLTFVSGDARPVTVAEFGLRRYFFGQSWGADGVAGMLKPAHMAVGFAMSGSDDGALQSVWRGVPRAGAFIAWGNIKVAWVGGANPRTLITRHFQKVPWVF